MLSLERDQIPTLKTSKDILALPDGENAERLAVPGTSSTVTPEKGHNVWNQGRCKGNFSILEEPLTRPNLRHQSQTPLQENVGGPKFGCLEFFNLRKSPRVASR